MTASKDNTDFKKVFENSYPSLVLTNKEENEAILIKSSTPEFQFYFCKFEGPFIFCRLESGELKHILFIPQYFVKVDKSFFMLSFVPAYPYMSDVYTFQFKSNDSRSEFLEKVLVLRNNFDNFNKYVQVVLLKAKFLEDNAKKAKDIEFTLTQNEEVLYKEKNKNSINFKIEEITGLIPENNTFAFTIKRNINDLENHLQLKKEIITIEDEYAFIFTYTTLFYKLLKKAEDEPLKFADDVSNESDLIFEEKLDLSTKFNPRKESIITTDYVTEPIVFSEMKIPRKMSTEREFLSFGLPISRRVLVIGKSECQKKKEKKKNNFYPGDFIGEYSKDIYFSKEVQKIADSYNFKDTTINFSLKAQKIAETSQDMENINLEEEPGTKIKNLVENPGHHKLYQILANLINDFPSDSQSFKDNLEELIKANPAFAALLPEKNSDTLTFCTIFVYRLTKKRMLYSFFKYLIKSETFRRENYTIGSLMLNNDILLEVAYKLNNVDDDSSIDKAKPVLIQIETIESRVVLICNEIKNMQRKGVDKPDYSVACGFLCALLCEFFSVGFKPKEFCIFAPFRTGWYTIASSACNDDQRVMKSFVDKCGNGKSSNPEHLLIKFFYYALAVHKASNFVRCGCEQGKKEGLYLQDAPASNDKAINTIVSALESVSDIEKNLGDVEKTFDEKYAKSAPFLSTLHKFRGK